MSFLLFLKSQIWVNYRSSIYVVVKKGVKSMIKTLKILNMVFNLLISCCCFWLVGFPLAITMIGGMFELLFTQEADTFGPMFLASLVGSVLVMLAFGLNIGVFFFKKKRKYVVLNTVVIVMNIAIMIFFTYYMASFFGDNLGEGSEVYENLSLLYGPAIFGGLFSVVTLFITIMVGLKPEAEWLESFVKKNKISNVSNNFNNTNNNYYIDPNYSNGNVPNGYNQNGNMPNNNKNNSPV